MNKSKFISVPYLVWLTAFIIVPLILVIYYSFGGDKGEFTLNNYITFFDPLYLGLLWTSVKMAFLTTVGCLILAYPLALILSSKAFVKKRYLIFLCVVPMWMNMLLRTYAWMTILAKQGILNQFLGLFGVEPIQFLYTNGAVLVGMIYNFLPFMILPIYSVMVKMDRSIIDAAEDLGANSFEVFKRVILPKSMAGIMTGIVMVFMPAITTFVISRLLGGGQYMLIGNLIEKQFIEVGNWGFGSAISVMMMLGILASMLLLNGKDKEDSVGGGLF